MNIRYPIYEGVYRILTLKTKKKTHPYNFCCRDESACCPSRAVGDLRSQAPFQIRKYDKTFTICTRCSQSHPLRPPP